MDNGDIFRRLRYIFNLTDYKVIKIFQMAESEVDLETVRQWLAREDDEDHMAMYDKELATFLNGLIAFKRGKRDGEQPKPEKRLNNNQIFRKIRIALELKDFEIIEILDKADFRLSKHELSAFFRKPTQKHYRLCKDQVLRNFLMGLQLTYRPKDD
jgi:uncharacterized protein YehS (DUF1456 family)